VLQRVSFGVFGILGLIFFPLTVAVVLADPGNRLVPTLMGVLCVAALEIASIQVGSVAHRSPTIALPVLAVPALTPILPASASSVSSCSASSLCS
jgi:hypothetical protein